jgi:uncharacterized protein
MGNPVVHFEIGSREPAKAIAFYSDLFGWKVNADNPMNYGIVDTAADGKGIMGGIGPDENESVTFYVAVPDVQAALDKAVSLGASVVRPVEVIPGMVTLAVFKDPQGHVLGIVADEPPPAQ